MMFELVIIWHITCIKFLSNKIIKKSTAKFYYEAEAKIQLKDSKNRGQSLFQNMFQDQAYTERLKYEN